MNGFLATRPKAQGGFSLIELMIAMVAGLIVAGAVVTFAVSSARSNSAYVNGTRLLQELRNVSDYITSELKRAGYDEDAMKYVANSVTVANSKFAPILVDSTVGANCVIYAYDRKPGNPGQIDVGNAEIRAIRRAVAPNGSGVIEVAESTSSVTPVCNGGQPDYTKYPAACNASSGWCSLSDPRTFDVQTFTASTVAEGTNSNGTRTLAGGAGFNALQIREFVIDVGGRLVGAPEDTRHIRSHIRVRADCLRQNLAAIATGCNVAPAP